MADLESKEKTKAIQSFSKGNLELEEILHCELMGSKMLKVKGDGSQWQMALKGMQVLEFTAKRLRERSRLLKL